MSKLKPTHAAESLQRNLDELKRRAELESLRPFCEEYVCFNPGANPKTAPVTMEELKKLARAWKLHGTSTIPEILTQSLALYAYRFPSDSHQIPITDKPPLLSLLLCFPSV